MWREKILNKPRRRGGVLYAEREEKREQEIGLWQEEREEKKINNWYKPTVTTYIMYLFLYIYTIIDKLIWVIFMLFVMKILSLFLYFRKTDAIAL